LYNDVLVYRTRAKAVSSKPIFEAGTERFMRDWRSGIVTVTVRDSRNREHDPILGVVPLRLSDILSTSSQVTRWYPLDGGIGFGRARISLLFRSVETRLPPNMLGWDVGTFEFLSDRILATGGWSSNAKLKLRTGGSSGKIPRTSCHRLDEKDGVYWDLGKSEGKHNVRLPVKHRYRSPVIFEFHVAGKHSAAAYACIWLQHLTDNEETAIDIPIWKTSNGTRLVQNYVTERNWKAKEVPGLQDLEEIGRLQFRARFKAGTDESHKHFVTDNDSRETFETWEACLAEGVRERVVDVEVPENVESMHNASLTQGRDILKDVSEREKKKWLSKTGTDWSGAFGDDPRAYTDKAGNKVAEPGKDRPPHDPTNPSSDEDHEPNYQSDTSSDLGIADATSPKSPNGSSHKSIDTTRTSMTGGSTMTQDANGSPISRKDKKYFENQAKRTERRKQRGLMQWKPARNVVFAVDEGKIGVKKLGIKMGLGGLHGREPTVETEAGA
jgi:hypothetical protein